MTYDGWSIQEIRDGKDALDGPLLRRVTVPISASAFKLELEVELGDADECQMRAASLVHPEIVSIPLGYVGAREGRWALRDLVLAELVGRYHSRPECDDQPCPHEKLRSAHSALGVADTWNLIVYGRCTIHQVEYRSGGSTSAADDDDLIPKL